MEVLTGRGRPQSMRDGRRDDGSRERPRVSSAVRYPWRNVRSSLFVGALVLLAATIALTGCGTGKAEPGGGIVFTVNRAGWGEIWVMRPDGSARRRLTRPRPARAYAAGSVRPAWSPDRTQIAFAAQMDTRVRNQRLTEIYVMRADGSHVRRLTRNEAVDSDPSWSPDGERIAFARLTAVGTEAARGGIFVMNANGGDEIQLTHAAAPTFDSAPAWSPKGSRIAFARVNLVSGFEQPRAAIDVVNPDGRGPRKLVDGGVEPDWSPDGKRIAFTSLRDRFGRTCFEECSPSGEIYVMAANGGDQRRLTRSKADDRSPSWSPDGRSIAFVSDRSNPGGHENEIYVMQDNGNNIRRITRNSVWDLDPDW
jgi:TolB protein